MSTRELTGSCMSWATDGAREGCHNRRGSEVYWRERRSQEQARDVEDYGKGEDDRGVTMTKTGSNCEDW